MKIILNTETEIKDHFDFSMKIVARQVIREALKQEHFPYDAEVSLLITESTRIHEINEEFRDIDKETDVLSFPNLEYRTPADFGCVEEDPAGAFDPDNGAVILGDIVINVDRVHSQALEYGHSEKREYAFLVAHSMMHLCGYDHMVPDEAAVMEAKQESILSSLGITREEGMAK